MDQLSRSYTILARTQAIISTLIAFGIFALYGLQSSLLVDTGTTMTVAILGVVGGLYYVSLHQLIQKRSLPVSTLVLTLITGANLILIIAATGGLDSPYYSFWLLAIVTAGIFGTADTIVVLALTTLYYLFVLVQHNFDGHYFHAHIGQLILSFAAGALAEWVYWRSRRASVQTAKVVTLSGKLTEEQLKAQVLMSQVGEGVVVVDSNRQIELFNQAAQQMTGWDEQSAQNINYNTVLNLHTADDQPLTDDNDPFIQAWAQGKNLVVDNLIMTSRSGYKLALSISVSPIHDQTGNITGGIALFRDISAEKEVERQRNEFVSTASHEMRTPVAAIEGYISLAMNPNVATIDDRAKNYLTKAHDTIQHLGDLFRDLLSVTKAEEGKLGGTQIPVNLTTLLQGAVDDMQFTASKKGITLVYQGAGAGGERTVNPIFWVQAIPERLREVIMNLIDNAIKFTGQGGVTVSMDGNEHEVTVTVSDTGVGIPAEDISHLFQKFYRVDNSATRTIGGTGLGLYLCRTVIELFKGRIWVTSEFGKGSSFHFSLPRLDSVEAEKKAAAITAANPPATPISMSVPAIATPVNLPTITSTTPTSATTPAPRN